MIAALNMFISVSAQRFDMEKGLTNANLHPTPWDQPRGIWNPRPCNSPDHADEGDADDECREEADADEG